jgi:hypothetical protein
LDIKEQWNGSSLGEVLILPIVSFPPNLMEQVLRQQEEMMIKKLNPTYNRRSFVSSNFFLFPSTEF